MNSQIMVVLMWQIDIEQTINHWKCWNKICQLSAIHLLSVSQGGEISKKGQNRSMEFLVVEVFIKGTMAVSNMLLQHFWKAPY